MSDLKIPTEIEIAQLIEAVGPLKSIARGLAFERDKLTAEVKRLEKDMPILMHLQAYNDIKKAIAARCIDLGTPDAIRKEFGL